MRPAERMSNYRKRFWILVPHAGTRSIGALDKDEINQSVERTASPALTVPVYQIRLESVPNSLRLKTALATIDRTAARPQ